MVRIRRFGVIRTATVAAVMYAVIILVASLFIGLPFVLIAGMAGRASGDGGIAAGIMGASVAGIVLFGLFGAVIYAIIGWIMTAIACAIYNLVAGWVGGIEVQLENVSGPSAPQWGGMYGGYPQPVPGYPQQAPGYPQTPGGGSAPPAGGPPPSQWPPSGYGQG